MEPGEPNVVTFEPITRSIKKYHKNLKPYPELRVPASLKAKYSDADRQKAMSKFWGVGKTTSVLQDENAPDVPETKISVGGLFTVLSAMRKFKKPIDYRSGYTPVHLEGWEPKPNFDDVMVLE